MAAKSHSNGGAAPSPGRRPPHLPAIGPPGPIPSEPIPAAATADPRVRAVLEAMSDAFLALGPDWRITYANARAAQLARTTPEALVGLDHWERWPDTRGEVEEIYRRVAARRVPDRFEHFYEQAGVWHDIRVHPSDDGGIAIFYRDITAQKQLEAERARQARELEEAREEAVAAQRQFRLLVERVRDYAIFLLDPEGRIVHWSPGAERMSRYAEAEVKGRHLRLLYPADGSAEDGDAGSHLRAAVEHGEYTGEGWRCRRDGERFPVRMVLTALRRGSALEGFSAILQDLTAEREAKAGLTAAMNEAQAANLAKSQFLANTSHEIRTPLNAIIGYAELLAMGLAGPLDEEQRRFVSRIQGTSAHLLSLVNDLLDLSKIESGEMRAASEAELLVDAVRGAVELVEPLAATRQVAIANACGTREASAYCGDSERVRQILVNLLSNAIRFTEGSGRVTVSCGTAATAPLADVVTPELGWAYVRVQDTGVGIPAEQLERIWDAFVQVDASRTRRFGGSGLGLTISRHLARLMGGGLTVDSELGLGSSFVLWLPAAEAREATARTAARRAEARATSEAAQAGAKGEPDALRVASMHEISDALLTEIERMQAMYVVRLRRDPGTARARGMRDAEVQDHNVTLLADLAQCLAVVAQGGVEADAMRRDGSAIQRTIARRHGAQRARMGWSERELVRDYEILREEVHAAVRRRVGRGGGNEVERALTILDRFVDQAVETAVDGMRQAVGA